jgi:type I restriction enzyme S subunit
MPDKLPKGWVKTTLGEIRRDTSAGISQQEMRGETFELYSVPAFSEGKPEVVTGDQVGSNKVVVAPGDVLICKINPRINRAWVVEDSHGHRQIASTEWIVFSKQEGISSDWLRYFFTQDTFRNYVAGNVSGVGGSLMRVRPAIVEKYPIMLAPTHEQERIVAKLDALLSRIAAGEAAARRALERLKRYRAVVLHAAVTGELPRDWRKAHKPDETGAELLKRLLQERRARWEEAELKRLHVAGKTPKGDKWKKRYPEPVKADATRLPVLPKGWAWVSIDQLTTLVTSGSRGWKSYYSKDGAIFIRSQDIRTDELDLKDIAHVRPPKNSEGVRTQVRQHDLLVTITGANVGKAALVKPKLVEAYVSQHVGLMRFVDTQSVRLAHLYITAPADGRKRLLGSAYGAGKPGLNLENLRELAIPLPPLAEQVEIVHAVERRLGAANRLAATLSRQLDRARATRQSLLREAFAGKLVPQSPKDEPASALLECIRTAREAEARKPKAKRMPKSKVQSIRRPLLDVLREHKRPITPEQLFRDAGFQSAEADLFYRELATLRKIIRERKPSGTEARAWPQRVRVLLELKED